METPKTLQEAIQYFSDEQVCIDAVAQMRWMGNPSCPECGAKKPYYLKTQKRWKCRDCRRQFSVKVGTIFEDSPISLCKWLPALWMLVNDKNGISSWELHRALGITQKSAWFVLHRLRLALRDGFNTKLPSDGGPIEVDETFIGGKARNMHAAIDEQMYRYNNRATKDNPLNDSDRFVAALAQVAGKRLTYSELTGKEREAPF